MFPVFYWLLKVEIHYLERSLPDFFYGQNGVVRDDLLFDQIRLGQHDDFSYQVGDPP
jgi:hypothetical protein